MRSVALPAGAAKGGNHSVYRDSRLGLCIDLSGPDGNVFNLFACAELIDRQMGGKREYRKHLDLVRDYCKSIGKRDFDGYRTAVTLFEMYYPVVTVLNKPWEKDDASVS
jgi:hypothetical protein